MAVAGSDALSVFNSADSGGPNSALRTLKDRAELRKKLLARTLGVNSEDLPATTLTDISPVDNNSLCQREKLNSERGELSNTNINEPPPYYSHIERRRESTPIIGNSISSTISSSPEMVSGNGNLNDGHALIIAKRLTDSTAEQKTKRRRTGDQTTLDSDGDEILEPFDDYFQVLQEEEKVFRGSATFLKGTQSANPHNDYSQHFIDTGQRPQNFIRDSGLAERFDEYPKLKELIRLKDELVATTATPPMYLKSDLRTFDLREIGSRFDVILIEPPLEEYHISGREGLSWDQIESLDIAAVADTRAFIWLWCGSTPEGLQRGRNCLKRWGFRRCEDICWVRTNKSKVAKDQHDQLQGGVARVGAGNLAAGNSLLQRTKEHCLMGIKGTVRRSTDGDFIHANVDIDLIITEEPAAGSIEKPLEIVLIAEHFCLGRRRLHLFGRDDTIRSGWLTIGPELTSSNFDANRYRKFFDHQQGNTVNSFTTGCTDRIEMLRPKSPVPMDKRGAGGGMMGGYGGGNMASRPDAASGGPASTWRRSAFGGNIRDRTRGNIQIPRHVNHFHGQQQHTPNDRERDQRSNSMDRNGMVNRYGGTSDRFSPNRYSGSHRSGHTAHYGRRGNGSNASSYSSRRNF